jgi:hypothetical protein
VIKRFLAVAVSAGLLVASAWLTPGGGEGTPTAIDPGQVCALCW